MWNLILIGTALCGQVDVHLATRDGSEHTGRLLAWNEQGVTLDVDGSVIDVGRQQIRTVAPVTKPDKPSEKPAAWATLIDGSLVVANSYTVDRNTATFHPLAGKPLTVNTKGIRYIRHSPPGGALDKQWQEIIAEKAAGDILVIRKPEDSLDYLVGVVGDVSAKTIQFDFEGDRIEVRREKIDGVVYYRSGEPMLAAPLGRLTTAGGSTLHVTSIRLVEAGLEVATPASLKLTVPWSETRLLDFSAGNSVFLSDLEPETVRWTPYISSGLVSPQLQKMFLPRRDASFDGGKLKLPGGDNRSRSQEYDKGLAIHSRTELVYRLAGRFRRLTAVTGIDERVRDNGHVRLVISADGRTLLDEHISGDDPPRNLDLELTGSKRLKILVDYGDSLDIGDHLNLCNARLLK